MFKPGDKFIDDKGRVLILIHDIKYGEILLLKDDYKVIGERISISNIDNITLIDIKSIYNVKPQQRSKLWLRVKEIWF